MISGSIALTYSMNNLINGPVDSGDGIEGGIVQTGSVSYGSSVRLNKKEICHRGRNG